jgi:hypothetical protein
MEGILRNLQNVIIYIYDLLIHSDTHERHLQILEQVLQRLQQNHLKINLENCIFGNKEVSYLGFTLTPEGIKPCKNKMKVIQTAKAPADVKTIRSFVGLCNFFRTHIKDFAVIGRTVVETHPEGFWIQRRPLAQSHHGRLHQPQKAAHLRARNGFPKN